MIVQFNCQQLKCTRDKFGNVVEGSPDTIQRVYYFWGLQMVRAWVRGLGCFRVEANSNVLKGSPDTIHCVCYFWGVQTVGSWVWALGFGVVATATMGGQPRHHPACSFHCFC